MSSSLGSKILRGVWSSMMGQGAVFILSLLLTPWIIKNLGTGGYGFYTLMWSALSYLGILSLGSMSAAQRFTAQWHLLEDRGPSLAALLRQTLRYEIGIGACGGLILFFLRNFLSNHFLHGSPALLALGPSVFALLALAVPAYFVSQFALAVLWGLKRFSLYNVLIPLQALLMTGGASFILFLGFGLKTIAVLFIFSQIFLSLIGIWLIRPLLRGPKIKLDSHDAKDYLFFCAKTALPLFLVTLITQGDRAMIGLWLPLTQLGYYALSATLAQKFNAISASISATSFPILAELIGKGEDERLKRIYLKSAELSFFMLLPLSILSFILIPQFISLWLGSAFSDSCTWPFRILVIANIVNLSMSMPNTLATGKGSPHWISYLLAGKALISLSLWIYMIPHWGIMGVALGSLIAEVCMAGPFLKRVHSRMLGLGLVEFFVMSLKRPFLASSGLAILGFIFHGMIDSWLGLLSFACFGTILYGAVSYGILDPESKNLIAKEITSILS